MKKRVSLEWDHGSCRVLCKVFLGRKCLVKQHIAQIYVVAMQEYMKGTHEFVDCYQRTITTETVDMSIRPYLEVLYPSGTIDSDTLRISIDGYIAAIFPMYFAPLCIALQETNKRVSYLIEEVEA